MVYEAESHVKGALEILRPSLFAMKFQVSGIEIGTAVVSDRIELQLGIIQMKIHSRHMNGYQGSGPCCLFRFHTDSTERDDATVCFSPLWR